MKKKIDIKIRNSLTKKIGSFLRLTPCTLNGRRKRNFLHPLTQSWFNLHAYILFGIIFGLDESAVFSKSSKKTKKKIQRNLLRGFF